MEILNALTEQLGVTQEQAKGGAGSIFQIVKEKLGDQDFCKVTEVVPDIDELLRAAPESVRLMAQN